MAIGLSVGTLSKTVTTAGTAERLSAASLKVIGFTVQAKTANTGTAHIGDSTVDYSTKPGLHLTSAQSVAFPPRIGFMYDLYDIWVDVSVSTEGVDVTYWV